MKIGIDARFLGKEGKGLGRYVQKLVDELEQDTTHQYYILLNDHNYDDYIPHNPHFHKIRMNIPWYSWQEQVIFPFMLYKYQLDLIHFTHFNVPILYRKPYIVTIHDLILLEYPTRRASRLNSVMYTIKNIAYSLVIKNAVYTAKKVIAISEYTKQSLIKHFRLHSDAIEMIYEGVDLERFNPLNRQEFDFAQYHISPGQYILYVGNVYPHKNIERLLEAFQQIIRKPDISLDLKLVLVGKRDYFFEKIIAYAQELDILDRVVFPGFVPDEQMIHIYEKCLFYVFPSLYEGFGLPPLEAIALGAPIVISNATCLPEIFGKYVSYFDPHSLPDMTEVLYQHIINPDMREKQKQYHQSILQKYSWQDMAQKTKTVYNTIKI
jgi:glycosyltransferase involved in cell wall biosynthesis